MKHLYLMRHGETLFNVCHKIQGWCDSPLTENGIEQAKKAGALLEGIPFDHYYSSTAERCCDTLEIVAGNVPYQRLKALKERNFGIFEGESEDLNPSWHDPSFTYDDLFPHYGGEYLRDVSKRMVAALTEIMEKPDHQYVLAVSHGGACHGFCEGLSAPIDLTLNGGFKNCNILHFTYDQHTFSFVEILHI